MAKQDVRQHADRIGGGMAGNLGFNVWAERRGVPMNGVILELLDGDRQSLLRFSPHNAAKLEMWIGQALIRLGHEIVKPPTS